MPRSLIETESPSLGVSSDCRLGRAPPNSQPNQMQFPRVSNIVLIHIPTPSQVAQAQDHYKQACQQIEKMAQDSWKDPSHHDFVLASFFDGTTSPQTVAYLRLLRIEGWARLKEYLFPGGQANKWWLQFAKRRFMNLTLN